MNVGPVWWKVEILTLYQVIAGEMRVRGRVQPTLNDPEPFIQLQDIHTIPLLPGAPRLQSIAEGAAYKPTFGAVRTLEMEPPPPDQTGMEMIKRFLLFQGTTFTAKGVAEFPVASDASLHRDLLFKSRFFPLFDVTLSVVGAESPPLQWPHCYLNRDLVVGLYLS